MVFLYIPKYLDKCFSFCVKERGLWKWKIAASVDVSKTEQQKILYDESGLDVCAEETKYLRQVFKQLVVAANYYLKKLLI